MGVVDQKNPISGAYSPSLFPSFWGRIRDEKRRDSRITLHHGRAILVFLTSTIKLWLYIAQKGTPNPPPPFPPWLGRAPSIAHPICLASLVEYEYLHPVFFHPPFLFCRIAARESLWWKWCKRNLQVPGQFNIATPWSAYTPIYSMGMNDTIAYMFEIISIINNSCLLSCLHLWSCNTTVLSAFAQVLKEICPKQKREAASHCRWVCQSQTVVFFNLLCKCLVHCGCGYQFQLDKSISLEY